MRDKRGISPLIATVLIIGFTIALAAIVMTWGGGFIRQTTEKTEASAELALKCSTELDFEIKNVDVITGTVNVENRGNVDISSLKFRFYSGDAIQGVPIDIDTTDTLTAFGVKTFGSADGVTIPAGADKVDAIATIEGDIVCGQAAREKSFTPLGE